MPDAQPPSLFDDADRVRRGFALRYRPRRFDELVGQAHVAAVLGRMIERGDVPRQVLLSGGSGLGKTTVGRIFAAAVLCSTPLEQRTAGDACGSCPPCADVTAPLPAHPDVIELDAASSGGKDEIREIAARSSLMPMRGRFKVYIIDEVHAISGPGGQAFLKLLEEPPSHVVFVLCTTNPEKLSTGAGGAGTIRGRCLELELVRPPREQLVGNLHRIAAAEGLELDDATAERIIDATDPTLGVRGTVTTLEKVSGALRDGDGDDAQLAALLGTVATSQLDALTAAIDGRHRRDALDLLRRIRAAASEETLRRALRTWARQQLDDAATGGDPDVVDRAADRLQLLLDLPPGEHWTDVALVRLCTEPQLAPPSDAASATDVAGATDTSVEGTSAEGTSAATQTPATDDDALAEARDLVAQLRHELELARVAVRVLRERTADTAAPDARVTPTPPASLVDDADSPPTGEPEFSLPPFVRDDEPDPTPGRPDQRPVAERLDDDARAALARAAQVTVPPGPSDVPPPSDPPPSDDELVEESHDAPPPARRSSGEARRPSGAAPTPAPTTATEDATPRRSASPKLQALLERVEAHDPVLARLVEQCRVTFPSGKVHIVPTDPAAAATLNTAHNQGVLFAAARSVGAARVLVARP